MEKLNKYSSFKIVLIYAIVSAVYIFASDHFLEIFISDVVLLSKLQTAKGLVFILITAVLLYILVKQNIEKTKAYYQEIIDVKQQLIKQSVQSQEEYSSLFDHSPLPMWLFDIETLRFLLVNEAACSVYGFSQEEYRSMTLFDIRPAEDIPALEKNLYESLKNESSSLSGIIRHKKKNGDIIHVKVKTTFAVFEGKKVRLASVVDFTAKINIQNKLMETNSKLQAASEIAGLGYWSNDLVKSEIQWSDEIYKIFEVNPDTFQLNLDNIKQYYHPEDQADFSTDFYINTKDKTINESERRILTASGKTKWVLERIYMIKDEEGKPIKLEGVIMDVTKRKLHEQEIWESNERFKILTKATVEAVIDWDINNHTVFWGEGFQTMLGYDVTLCDKYFWQKNIHPKDRRRILTDLKEALADPKRHFFNTEYRFFKANHSIAHVQHKGILVRDANGKAIRAIGALIDMTETLEKMRKIELQNKALKDIAWTQSHVVRAPLANVLGCINLLKSNYQTGKEDEKLLEYISTSAEQLDDVIREIVKKTSEIKDL